jgi:hypothetical protein
MQRRRINLGKSRAGAGDGTRTRDALLGRHRAVSNRLDNTPRLAQSRFSCPLTCRHPHNRGQGYRERTEPGGSILDLGHLVQCPLAEVSSSFGAILVHSGGTPANSGESRGVVAQFLRAGARHTTGGCHAARGLPERQRNARNWTELRQGLRMYDETLTVSTVFSRFDGLLSEQRARPSCTTFQPIRAISVAARWQRWAPAQELLPKQYGAGSNPVSRSIPQEPRLHLAWVSCCARHEGN